MTKEKFIELLREMCEDNIIFVDDNDEVNFNCSEVEAWLTVEGIK